MAIVPTWRRQPAPPVPACGPNDRIAAALQARDLARLGLNASERALAIIIAQQPLRYRRSFEAFRAAGGHSAQQWGEWLAGKPPQSRHLQLVSDCSAP
jgi:hypothetical protein